MIPRYQRIAYWCLVAAIGLMAVLLIHGCMHTQSRNAEMRDESPIPAPVDSPDETVTVVRANDLDASIANDQITLALPQEPGVRARILLDPRPLRRRPPRILSSRPHGPGHSRRLLPPPPHRPASPCRRSRQHSTARPRAHQPLRHQSPPWSHPGRRQPHQNLRRRPPVQHRVRRPDPPPPHRHSPRKLPGGRRGPLPRRRPHPRNPRRPRRPYPPLPRHRPRTLHPPPRRRR